MQRALLCALILVGLSSIPTTASALCGDCDLDGSVTILDALLAAQMGTGTPMPTAAQLQPCDANGSGNIDVLDALLIAQEAAGLPVVLTCPPPTVGIPGMPLGSQVFCVVGDGSGTAWNYQITNETDPLDPRFLAFGHSSGSTGDAEALAQAWVNTISNVQPVVAGSCTPMDGLCPGGGARNAGTIFQARLIYNPVAMDFSCFEVYFDMPICTFGGACGPSCTPVASPSPASRVTCPACTTACPAFTTTTLGDSAELTINGCVLSVSASNSCAFNPELVLIDFTLDDDSDGLPDKLEGLIDPDDPDGDDDDLPPDCKPDATDCPPPPSDPDNTDKGGEEDPKKGK